MKHWEERVTEDELNKINIALMLITKRDVMNTSLQDSVFTSLIENGLTQEEADKLIDVQVGKVGVR